MFPLKGPVEGRFVLKQHASSQTGSVGADAVDTRTESLHVGC